MINKVVPELPKVLSIAGSDPSGGAGLQADLKVMAQLGVYGAAAVTALTRQTSEGVQDIYTLDSNWVLTQITEVLYDLRPQVIKTGMLQSPLILQGLAKIWRDYQAVEKEAVLVVDPVLHSGTGVSLLDKGGLKAFREELLPYTTVLTPNVPEAEAFTGMQIKSTEDMEKAARLLLDCGVQWVLIKGGHFQQDRGEIVDILYSSEQIYDFPGERVPAQDPHGTGCTLASALASYLALSYSVPESTARAIKWVRQSIANAIYVGKGRPVVCQQSLQ
ncbi:bifunctional hydroxymethylpyrimidine kinase/phosphomethylpyrimidine kinase [Heliorestis acidaminivorans]|uniref:Hydroxymethylpyrimidine/phosphomethylpyrimidine kinase n=1 Tax=Heliorestis acidaminivorans TaxID=553427 RepID=A0A6I0F3Q4_9FIRM|nr:bifunctional hydroxymethylpyrimidine kinase/phosphomethylpyrimidine kinase [Heliorestis acidaminivorans]KAB2953357.1 bifunctional hydroxymethylpyrimidine kinase/phosphomethylpyrimidine kinase [Heliorestis acidaminivorans]